MRKCNGSYAAGQCDDADKVDSLIEAVRRLLTEHWECLACEPPAFLTKALEELL